MVLAALAQQEPVDLPVAIVVAHPDAAVVLTHAYEGGHPDHEAVAFAVQASGRPRIEMAGYHAGPNGHMIAGQFLDDAARSGQQAAVRGVLAWAVARVDVVHLHGIDFDACLPPLGPPPGPPALVTLQLPPDWCPPGAMRPARLRTWLRCMSDSQQRACPPGLALLPPIANGVPVQALTAARHAPRVVTVILGRRCPEKDQHLALRAAHLAGVSPLLGGEVFPCACHQDHSARDVASLLDARRRPLGPVGFARKRRLLSAARSLLVGSTAAETSSLAAIGRVGDIDRDRCRAVARERLSAAKMTDTYLGPYQQLAA